MDMFAPLDLFNILFSIESDSQTICNTIHNGK